MHIRLFTDTLGDLNGVSRFILDMGAQAQRHGVNFSIYTSTHKPLPSHDYIHNLPYRLRMPMPFYQELDLVYPNLPQVREILDKEPTDWVHISTPGPFGWAAKQLAHKRELPLIGTYHTDFPAYLEDLTRSRWVKKRTDKVMNRFYDPFVHVFSRSSTYQDIMAKELGIQPHRSSVIAPGTDLERFHPKHRNPTVWEQYGLSNQTLKVLYVGRMNIEKNLPFLVKVWRRFKKEHPQLQADLILVGEGRYRRWQPKLKNDDVYFLGPVVGETLSQIYASSDLFVFPSTTDTLGQVIMEAQASGVGCLVSDVGGPKTLVADQQTGRILPADNETAWVNALEESLSSSLLRTRWFEKTQRHRMQYDIVDSFRHFLAYHCDPSDQQYASG